MGKKVDIYKLVRETILDFEDLSYKYKGMDLMDVMDKLSEIYPEIKWYYCDGQDVCTAKIYVYPYNISEGMTLLFVSQYEEPKMFYFDNQQGMLFANGILSFLKERGNEKVS